MSEASKEQFKNIVIAVGLFAPLVSYLNHLLQSYGGSVSVLSLTSSEQLSLIALIITPLLVLRLFNIQGCLPGGNTTNKLKTAPHKHTRF